MTKREAQKALVEGQKIKHQYFADGEFVYSVDNEIFDESGFKQNFFWQLRQCAQWNSGWSICTD